jgi:tetratricopeptide (TPR) repeat protein
MKPKSRINIVSRLSPEFTSKIMVDGTPYEIFTEDRGAKSHEIITTIYLKGKIVFSKKYNYSHLTRQKGLEDKVIIQMGKHHKSTIKSFLLDLSPKKKLKSEYFNEVQDLLKNGDGKSALDLLRKALDEFPLDPFYLSYYGCLVSIVDKKPKEGIKICKKAIKMLDTSIPFGSEFFHSAFYLNLGRAFLSDGKKSEAVKSFKKGLRNDPEDSELLTERAIQAGGKKEACNRVSKTF